MPRSLPRLVPATLLLVAASTPAFAQADAASADPVAAVRAYKARIAAIDDAGPTLAAVLAVNPEAEREAASAKGPLAGRAVLVKDNIETAGPMPTTAGSLALADNVTGRDAPLIARMRQAGGVVLGKTNLSEWANIRSSSSSSGWSAVGGQTRNPHAIDRTPCGSSSGSGAAVAAGLAWAAIGTETDGSITCPASVAGVVGFKPTVGLVSRTHVVPISHSQDTAGPITNSVADAALLLNAIAGTDPADPATAQADRRRSDFTAGLATASLQGVRIGVLRRQAGRDPAMLALFDAALADLARAGAVLVPVDYDPPAAMGAAEYRVLLHELRADLGAYLRSLPGNPPVRSLDDVIAFNRAHPPELRWFGQDIFETAARTRDIKAYRKARATSLRLAGPEGIDRLMAQARARLLIAPTEGPAWPIDLVTRARGLPDVGAGSLAAIAGTPHLTVPMGAVEGLPVGLSFLGRKWDDARVLAAGAAYERARTARISEPSLRRWGE